MLSSWRSRGYLPHFDDAELTQDVTFRLHDSLPAHIVAGWREELRTTAKRPDKHLDVVALDERIAAYEDAGHGECWLREPRIADLVEGALLHFDSERYQLLAWCVMPNHVHTLFELRADQTLAGVLHSWKSYTSHRANTILNRDGTFWAREYHDRMIRNEVHMQNAVAYIEGNPVKAGLCDDAQSWPWSSARRR